jgi:alginate O-acetyltransferase complex protein AlgI
MVFSSLIFIFCFLPAFLLIYYLADKKYKNIVLLLSSILFYSWGAPQFVFVILGTTLIDFHLVRWMDRMENRLHRRLLLTLSVSINLGLLFYFKYSGFFVENVNRVLAMLGDEHVTWTKLALPIGISFYTFETITYVVDVYRRVHKPLNHFWDYQLYIILFPKLIAGPIIRYHNLADQITDRTTNDTLDNRLTGFYRFIIGLAKKVLIANHLGAEADAVFEMDYATLDSMTAWTGILAYTFQIYFDFSGYSDMAIGLAKMVGFNFPENFDNPYISGSITEFWKRWHISLGNWMRQYLYIPLGGNRVKTKTRLYFNLWFVFLASGLWHGASWSFVCWGAYHGTFLVLERIFLLRIYERIGRLPSMVITFFFIVVGWVFFRIEKLSQAKIFLKSMFDFSHGREHYFDSQFYTFFILAILFSFYGATAAGNRIQAGFYTVERSKSNHLVMAFTCAMLFIISAIAITASGFNPFIYFRF